MLTVATCRNAKGKDKAYKLYDEKGLLLVVYPNGSKYWRVKYRVDGIFPDCRQYQQSR